MNILFWNVNEGIGPHVKNAGHVDHIIKSIIREYNCDFVILAEHQGDLQLSGLERDINLFLTEHFDGCPRIKMYASQEYTVRVLFENSYYTIKEITIKNVKYIIVGVHFPSKLCCTDEERQAKSNELTHDIIDYENKTGSDRTLIVGDFNANPFENCMVNANSLHSISVDKEARRLSRTVLKTEYKMFYNPMWALYGTHTAPYGTYYVSSGKINHFYWNIFDQVIMRPSLISFFDQRSLKIISRTGDISLLKDNYKPDRKISDHLPIFLTINQED